jgi:hypothetical protein
MRSNWRSDVPLYLERGQNDAFYACSAGSFYSHAGAVETMFAGDGLPERSTYLIALVPVNTP